MTTVHDILTDADLFRAAYPRWPSVTFGPPDTTRLFAADLSGHEHGPATVCLVAEGDRYVHQESCLCGDVRVSGDGGTTWGPWGPEARPCPDCLAAAGESCDMACPNRTERP